MYLDRPDADEFIFNRKNGSNEGDIFVGTIRNDVYNGLGGNDSLLGNWGNDRLIGGAGNDRISGEGGRDVMSGGSGLDTFYYTANGNIIPGAGHGFDRITDFDPVGQDHDDIVMLINYGFGVSTFADLKRGMRMSQGDTVMNFGGGDILVLEDIRISQLRADDFLIIPA
jgi:serralysin